MAKHSTKKSPRQDLVVVNTAANVQIPLPLLSVLEDAESAFFGLCVATGKQVLEAMMEQDRIALCGPAGRHDPERQALRGGSTESAIVLGHKERNVLEHLPQALRPSVRRALRQAWASSEANLGRRQLERLAASLDAEHPGAAASLREGLEETLTLLTLGIDGALYRTLRSTNPIENLNGSVADYTRNVKRWRGGGMILRWVGAAAVEASKRFRKIRGHRDLPLLVQALERHEIKQGVRTEEEAA
jgi:hypothetical protein